MKSAVIITTDNYPCGDAGAVREHAFAKMLQGFGYRVEVLGYGRAPVGFKGCYDGVDYFTFRPRSDNRIIRGFFRLIAGTRIMNSLHKMSPKPDLLLVVEVPNRTYRALECFAKKHGCKLIHDSVEWYSPEQFSNGVNNWTYRTKDQLNSEIIDHQWSVIAISKYLHAHFEKKCKKAIYIPVIMDVQNTPYRTEIATQLEKIQFAYAGSPGRKDYLAELLKGFSLLTEEQLEKLEIHLYGINRQQLVDICGVSEETLMQLGTSLVAHGRVPREKAVQAVMDADYSVLLRDENLRYAKAGFPTKIVESLMCGTPVFCNLSSDLGLYLKDGENAVLIHGHDPEDVKNAAQKVLLLSPEERQSMRQQARETALKHFDYRNYIEQIGDLLK